MWGREQDKMNITCMRVTTLTPILFRREKISFVLPMTHCRERHWELFVNLASLSQQGGDLTCQKVLDRPCSPTIFTLLAPSLLSLSKRSYSITGEKTDRSYRYVQALSFSEIKGCLNSKLNLFFMFQHLCSNILRCIAVFYLPLSQCQTENRSSGALIINNQTKNS